MKYKTVLENEVYVDRKTITGLFDNNEVFVIGYGSLLYPSGWKGRGMVHPPKAKDLVECTVTGYERGCYGIYYPVSKGWHTGLHYYGVVENEKCHFNGVLARIHSVRDWANLMYTEFIAGFEKDYNYRVVDVTDKIEGVTIKKGQRIHMVANESQNKRNWTRHHPDPGYYHNVAAGVKKSRSLEFQHEFFETGGLTKKQSEQLSKNDRLKGIVL